MTPWIALGAMFQGVYLVGSIGIIITKRTAIYPVATGIAAAVSLAANAFLIPRYGILGAAWANATAYGTLALVTVGFSLRLLPDLVRVGPAAPDRGRGPGGRARAPCGSRRRTCRPSWA